MFRIIYLCTKTYRRKGHSELNLSKYGLWMCVLLWLMSQRPVYRVSFTAFVPQDRLLCKVTFEGFCPEFGGTGEKMRKRGKGRVNDGEKTSGPESLSFFSETYFTTEQLLEREPPLILERKRDKRQRMDIAILRDAVYICLHE